MFKIPSLVIANRNEDDPDENDDEELLSGSQADQKPHGAGFKLDADAILSNLVQ